MSKILVALCIALLVFSSVGSVTHASSRNIAVVINNSVLVTVAEPMIIAGRILVPVRAVSEALGAIVHWRDDGSIIIRKVAQTIILLINQPHAFVNDAFIPLDVPARVVSGRTLVPIRFISEAFGASVTWDGITGVVAITMPALNADGTRSANIAPKTEFTETQRLFIGMGDQELRHVLGEPDRIETTLFGYDWWVYNKLHGGLFLAGVADNTLTAVYTDSPMWKIGELSPGQSFDEFTAIHDLLDNVRIDYKQIPFTIIIDSETKLERPIAATSGQVTIFYLDTARNREISAIQVMDKRSFLATGGYSKRWLTTAGRQPDFGIPQLNDAQRQKALQGQERIMLDLVNSFRQRNGINALQWHEALASAAKEHSRDMFSNNFFSHNSPSTGSPFDRMDNAGIRYRTGGENLAWGMPDAIGSHHGLLNSPGHRRIIQTAAFTHLGIGIVERYYTQKYMQQ